MTAMILLLTMIASAASSSLDWVRKEHDVSVYSAGRSSWVKRDKVPHEHKIKLTVAMRVEEDRRAELERRFWDVSNPRSQNYGKYQTIDEITNILAIPESNVATVQQHFLNAGADAAVVAPNRDMMTVTLSVRAAEVALNTTLHFFTHNEYESVRIIRATEHYWLPQNVAQHVSMVGELLQFPRLRLKSLSNLKGGAAGLPNGCDRSCNGMVTPEVLTERYKLPSPSNGSKMQTTNSMAVAEFQGQYYRDADLSTFGKSCHRNVIVDKVVGGNRQEAGIEAELDIEYIKSVAPDVPLTVVYSDQYSLLDWVNQVTSSADAPLVHSVSYGNDEVQQASAQYMYTCNSAFMKAGLRGISILIASGDQGVCGRSGCGFIMHARFHPDFPAASPYVTAVGGTNFAGSSIGDETTWADGGGGFSDTFDIPAYQKEAVAAYLASPDANFPPQKLWNRTGRGYPDVAALGGMKNPYCVSTSGVFEGVAGTSASCPVVAGVFALLNGIRLDAGKPPMGFLNPFIYQNPSGFYDVMSGTNGGGRKYGFTAVKGWDAATGMGTPNFEALSKLAMTKSDASEIVV